MFYETSKGHELPSNPFKALVAPRPIGWIATRARSGAENLAPYSFFNAVSDDPPIVMFSSGGPKDSVTYAKESGCFVAHSVSDAMFDAMNQSSANYPRGTSEIAATGLAVEDARLVNAPRLVDAPSALECVVTDIISTRGSGGKDSAYIMVIGEVVGVHIHDDFITPEGRFDSQKAALMARCGYADYTVAAQMLAKPRPSAV